MTVPPLPPDPPPAGPPPAGPPPAGPVLAADPTAELRPGDLPPADRDGWRRLHKVTPVLKGWKVVAVALVLVGQQRGDELLAGNGVPSRTEVLITLGVLAVLAVAASVWAYLSWRMTRFRVDDGVLQLHSGVLFRQQRQARLDRLQAVDVVQPLLGRVFGLSELKLEVAGGAGSDVKLAYLRDAEAQRLRGVLLAQAAGLTYEGEEAPEAPEQELLQVPVPRLVGSLLLSGGTIGALVFLVAAVVASTLHPAALFGAIPAVLGTLSAYWGQFTLGFGFRVAASPDGLRLRHGLLETRAQTVPPGRVQAVRLVQPLLWRRRDWWKVEVNVAGYGVGADGQHKETVLLPVGPRGEAFTVLSVVLPDLGHPDPVRLLEDGLTGLADEQGRADGYTCAPRASRWLDPVGWRRHGVAVTERALVLRSGRLRRSLVLVPHERTQSLGLEQGPVQRRLGVATVVAHSTPGPVAPRIEHLAADVAGRLLDEQAERARRARATSGPERWMEQVAPSSLVDLVKPGGPGSTTPAAPDVAPSARLVDQRARNLLMDAIDGLSDGDDGLQGVGTVEYIEMFFDVVDDDGRWRTWSTLTADEVEQVDHVRAVLEEACADRTWTGDQDVAASGWPQRIQPVAARAAALMFARGRFSEHLEEAAPGDAPSQP